MSTAVSGVIVETNNHSILVVCEDGESRWFSLNYDIVEEDRDEAETFEPGDEVDFNVTEACAKKHGL